MHIDEFRPTKAQSLLLEVLGAIGRCPGNLHLSSAVFILQELRAIPALYEFRFQPPSENTPFSAEFHKDLSTLLSHGLVFDSGTSHSLFLTEQGEATVGAGTIPPKLATLFTTNPNAAVELSKLRFHFEIVKEVSPDSSQDELETYVPMPRARLEIAVRAYRDLFGQ